MLRSPQLFLQHIFQLLTAKQYVFSKKFLIAFSGGLDSSVLLHVLHQCREIDAEIQIRAIHVNHQLQAQSDQWQVHCESICRHLDIEIISQKVSVDRISGKGLESAAREARYKVFNDLLHEQEILVTAHHKDDQIETLLLRLLRGTGIEGAAAIQAIKLFGSGYLMRPLLNITRQELIQCAELFNFTWIEDPSNVNACFDRNYLRHDVLPLIEKRWPAYRESLSRFSRHAAEASQLLDSYIEPEYCNCLYDNKIQVNKLLKYSTEKKKSILRFWIKQHRIETPGEKCLDEILNIVTAKQDANPVITWSGIELRRFSGQLILMSAMPEFNSKQVFTWNLQVPLRIPGAGILRCQKMPESSMPNVVEVRFRQGGEVCSIPGRQGRRSLKKLFQDANIAPWLRDRTPLIICDHHIVAVPDLFCADCFTRFEWERESASPNTANAQIDRNS